MFSKKGKEARNPDTKLSMYCKYIGKDFSIKACTMLIV